MFDPKPGDIVCDCRYRHLKIKERDGDDLILEDGSSCSLSHCCDDPDNHSWSYDCPPCNHARCTPGIE